MIDLFQVTWTKPTPLTTALTQAESQESGIYAMLKKVGENFNLFYIGKSADFYKRSGTHRNNISHMMTEAEIKKCYIAFGLITTFEHSQMSHTISPEQLKDIESFYINYYRPVGNSDSTKKGYKGNTIISFNSGKCFQKHKIISNSENLVKLLKYYF